MRTNLPLMRAEFVVTGMNFSPHECTAHFGIEPSEILVKGKRRGGLKRPVPHSSWSIESKRERLDSTDEALRSLTILVWPRRRQIRNFTDKNGLRITFVLKITGGLGNRNFLYELSPKTIEQIRYFRAHLYIDVY